MRDRVAWLIVCMLLLLVSAPYLFAFATASSAREFLGSFYNALDTPVYLSAMRAGARGDWLRTLPYTTEPHAAALYYPFYLLLGHIAPPDIITYHVARVVAALSMGWALWRLLAELLPTRAERRIALMLALLGLGLGWPIVLSGAWTVVQPTSFYVYESNLFGSAYVNPHFPLTAAFEFLALAAYLRAQRPPYRAGTLLIGALSCLAVGLALPYHLVTLGAILFFDVVGESVRQRRLWTPTARAALLIWLPSSLLIVYYAVFFRFAPFWAELVAEWTQPAIYTLPDYVFGYGLLLVFALVGAIALLRQRQRTPGERLLIAWLCANGLLILSPLDFSERTSLGFSVALASLAAIVLARIVPNIKWVQRLLLAGAPQKQDVTLSLQRLVCLLLLPAALLESVSGPVFTARFSDLPFYLPADDTAAMRWLSAHAQPQDVALAQVGVSNLIPGLTDARVYTGHAFETFQFKRKNAEIQLLFDESTSDETRHDFYRAHGITYVYLKPNARGSGGYDGSRSADLELVFSAGAVRLYRVR